MRATTVSTLSALLAALLLAAPGRLPAAGAAYPYDVPYVPTPIVVVDEMLRFASVTAADYVMDLGCGDGRIVIEAARKFGARGIGLDLDEALIAEARVNAQAAGVTDRARFERQDLFKTDLSPATVITMYLLPGVNRRLRPELLKLKPGTRIVSHDFDLDDWQPDRKTTLRKNIFLWVVPAPVAGTWTISAEVGGVQRNYVVDVYQKFQQLDGFVRNAGPSAGLWQPRIEGDRISFTIVHMEGGKPGEEPPRAESALYFEGRVDGNVMQGQFRRNVGREETTTPWRAVRLQ
ncbi:MAG: SAM-dependent methyltransferase [Burkholderiales bacterium]